MQSEYSFSVHKLRRIYSSNHVRRRKYKTRLTLSNKQYLAQQKQLKEILPKLLQVIKDRKYIVFVDEAVFTTNQSTSDCWWKMGSEPPFKEVNSLSFRAVAVIAATDMEGNLVCHATKDFSIKKPNIVEFLDDLSLITHQDEQYIFWDNLKAHHSKEVRETAERNNQILLFNGSYSSKFNPIESLWAYAKRYFRKEIMTLSDYKNQSSIHQLVTESIKQVSPLHLKRYSKKVMRWVELEV